MAENTLNIKPPQRMTYDEFQHKKELGVMDRICMFAAGIDEETISVCSSYERNKYKILGSLVYIPVVTSFIAVFLTCSFLNASKFFSLIIALFWSGVAFVIERGLIGNLRPNIRITFRVGLALAIRIILAVSMSMIISELMIMTIFEDDIMKQQGNISLNNDQEIINKYEQKNKLLDDKLQKSENKMNESRRRKEDEADGLAASKRAGHGDRWIEKNQAYLNDSTEWERVKREVQEQKAINESEKNKELAKSTQIYDSNGILTSITYLHKLSGDSSYALWALIFTHIFFLCVELMPLFTKLLVQDDEYYKTADQIINHNWTENDLRAESKKDETKEWLKLYDKIVKSKYEYEAEMADIDLQCATFKKKIEDVGNRSKYMQTQLNELVKQFDESNPREEDKDFYGRLIDDYKKKIWDINAV